MNTEKIDQATSKFGTISKLLALVFLFSSSSITNSAVAKTISISTTAYKDVAVNVTRTIGGIVPAAHDSNLSAQISAIIEEFHVDTGHAVKKGDLLVSLDCRENKLKLKVASSILKAERVQLEHAKKQFNQAKKLNKQGNISKEIYNKREAEEDRIKATVENKKASYAIAEMNVERCEIKAPYDGYITKRIASTGELTQPGTHLLHLISKSNNIVEVKINNRLLESFSTGKNYQFEFNNKKYALKVDFVLPVLDTTTRNHIARLSFIDTQAITGSVGKVSWQEAEASIPPGYIVQRNNKSGIFIVKNNPKKAPPATGHKNTGDNNSNESDTDGKSGKTTTGKVTTGKTTTGIAEFIEVKNASGGKAAILSLDENTLIITKGRYSVNDGDTLMINSD